LILAPTKELANQIYESLCRLTSSFVFLQTINLAHFAEEGTDDTQKEVFDIVVSTPARLLAVLRRNPSLVGHVRQVVLDEADLLLSYGYKEEMKKIKECLPQRYQTILTSATLNEDITEIKTLMAVGPLTSLKLKVRVLGSIVY